MASSELDSSKTFAVVDSVVDRADNTSGPRTVWLVEEAGHQKRKTAWNQSRYL
jgi:hypothetical protein